MKRILQIAKLTFGKLLSLSFLKNQVKEKITLVEKEELVQSESDVAKYLNQFFQIL